MDPRPATFPRAARLLRPPQYTTVFARGRKFVCDGFVVIAAANGEDRARLGLALAKRRIGRAVDRSRVKRVIRESFRHVRPDLPATDIVVLARNRTVTMDNASLTAQLNRIWHRLARSAH